MFGICFFINGLIIQNILDQIVSHKFNIVIQGIFASFFAPFLIGVKEKRVTILNFIKIVVLVILVQLVLPLASFQLIRPLYSRYESIFYMVAEILPFFVFEMNYVIMSIVINIISLSFGLYIGRKLNGEALL